MRSIFFSLALTLITSSAMVADERTPRVSLILAKVTAEQQRDDSVWFLCDIVLLNETDSSLTVNTNFGSAFDALEVVVTNGDGKVLRQQPYTYHQSPYSPAADRTFELIRGKTKAELLFPLSEFGKAAGPLKVRIVGTLPGSSFHRILSTDTLTVSPKK